jgi:hypothetical protein
MNSKTTDGHFRIIPIRRKGAIRKPTPALDRETTSAIRNEAGRLFRRFEAGLRDHPNRDRLLNAISDFSKRIFRRGRPVAPIWSNSAWSFTRVEGSNPKPYGTTPEERDIIFVFAGYLEGYYWGLKALEPSRDEQSSRQL